MSDIETACCTVTVKQQSDCNVRKSKQILASVEKTMSDCHVVKKNFNQLLEAYRADILPQVTEGWSELTSDQQASLSQMISFTAFISTDVLFFDYGLNSQASLTSAD